MINNNNLHDNLNCNDENLQEDNYVESFNLENEEELENIDSNLVKEDIPNKSIDVSELEIMLQFEVGKVLISLAELMQLKIGQIIEVKKLPPKVNIMANGNKIGEGLLVEINGRIGVKICKRVLN